MYLKNLYNKPKKKQYMVILFEKNTILTNLKDKRSNFIFFLACGYKIFIHYPQGEVCVQDLRHRKMVISAPTSKKISTCWTYQSQENNCLGFSNFSDCTNKFKGGCSGGYLLCSFLRYVVVRPWKIQTTPANSRVV